MFKKAKITSLIVILALIISAGQVIAKTGHKITNLDVVVDPKKPEKNEVVDLLTATFKLKSSTGISWDRIRLDINSKPVTLAEENITITRLPDELDEEKGLEFAEIIIEKPEIAFTQIDNNLEVLYLISAISTDPPQARKAETVKAKDSSPNNGGSGGNGGGGNSENGDTANGETVTITPRLFRIFVTEVNGDGMVSSTPRQFKITTYHDERIIASVDENGYNAVTHPIISRLKIYQQNVNDKEDKTLVTDDFTFNLEGNGSESSSQYESIANELKTVFISEEKTITERQNLIFKVNLKTLAENSGVQLEDNIITKDQDKISISAQELEFNSFSIADSEISFSSTENKKKNYFFDSESFVITGVFNGTESVSSVDDVEFYKQKSKTVRKPKIKNSLNKKKSYSATGALNTTATITGSPAAYTVSIPTILRLKSTLNALEKNGFTDSVIAKELRIPINLITKTSNGLDLIVNGELLLDKALDFTLPVIAEDNGAAL